MSDISITVTADPTQAVASLNEVKNAGDALAKSAQKVQAASDAAATDAMNGISSVSRESAAAADKTASAIGSVSSGIQTATKEAAKVSGALGKSIPVVSQLGSAIASALTGPVGAVSAAVGLVIAGITKMIKDVEDRVSRLKASAGAQAGAAYDRLMQGRADYAADLQTLSRVREINRMAQETRLTADQLAQFRQLAGQIGISARDVTASGIKSGALGDAARSLKQQRRFYADQDYQNYLDALSTQLAREIDSSGLDNAVKKKLKSMSVLNAADVITSRAQSGAGFSMEEFKSYQSLYQLVKPLAEVRASYNRDAMLGRSQAELNSAVVEGIRKTNKKSAAAAASESEGPARKGTLAYGLEQMEAERREAEAAKARADRGERLLHGLDRQIQLQELVSQGKSREAFILQNRLQLEDTVGQLTARQIQEVEARAGRLYDLQHPVAAAPDLAPAAPASSGASRARSTGRVSAQYSMPLDSLQRIGANLRGAASSPEKLVMDQQLATTKEILGVLQAAVSGPRSGGGMFFT